MLRPDTKESLSEMKNIHTKINEIKAYFNSHDEEHAALEVRGFKVSCMSCSCTEIIHGNLKWTSQESRIIEKIEN